MFEASGNAILRRRTIVKRLVCTLGMLVILAMMLTGLLQAQQFGYRVAADIPSDFYVGDQQFPAGNYIFIVNYGNHAVTVTDLANRHSFVVLASPVEYASPGYDNRDNATVVELKSVGGRYQLADIKARTTGVSFSTGNPVGTFAENPPLRIVASLR